MLDRIKELWEKYKIANIHFEFSCGGDSMNNTELIINTALDIPVKEYEELVEYFVEQVYDNIEFYVNSDGNYLGEFGEVIIEQDEDGEFTYVKDAKCEYNERIESVLTVELTEEEIQFTKNYVESINGSSDTVTTVTYSRDFILTDRREQVEKDILDKIDSAIENFEPKWTGDPQEDYDFKVVFSDNMLIELNNYEYIYEESY